MGLEEIDKQTSDQEVDASLKEGEICNRAPRLFEHRREFSVLLTKCCSNLVIALMQVGYIPAAAVKDLSSRVHLNLAVGSCKIKFGTSPVTNAVQASLEIRQYLGVWVISHAAEF